MTGRVINRNRATPLPMLDEVIEQVHWLARRQKSNEGIVFLDCDQQPCKNLEDYYYLDNNNEDYVPNGITTITVMKH
jgi:hypothetical protein